MPSYPGAQDARDNSVATRCPYPGKGLRFGSRGADTFSAPTTRSGKVPYGYGLLRYTGAAPYVTRTLPLQRGSRPNRDYGGLRLLADAAPGQMVSCRRCAVAGRYHVVGGKRMPAGAPSRRRGDRHRMGSDHADAALKGDCEGGRGCTVLTSPLHLVRIQCLTSQRIADHRPAATIRPKNPRRHPDGCPPTCDADSQGARATIRSHEKPGNCTCCAILASDRVAY